MSRKEGGRETRGRGGSSFTYVPRSPCTPRGARVTHTHAPTATFAALPQGLGSSQCTYGRQASMGHVAATCCCIPKAGDTMPPSIHPRPERIPNLPGPG
jgi:hypothetical protein